MKIDEDEPQLFQTWKRLEVIDFYNKYKDNAVWIGHNIEGYDNAILQGLIKGENVKEINDNIIHNHKYYPLNIKLNYYDLYKIKSCGLKTFEAFAGKDISESEVPFDIDEPLSEEQRASILKYNQDDLNQTFDNFCELHDEFDLRLTLLHQFKMPLSYLSASIGSLASRILKVKKQSFISEEQPFIPDNLQVKNPLVKRWFINGDWKTSSLDVDLCGVTHKIGKGGIHGGVKGYHEDVYYIDVSGYFNLVMINLDLYPRCMDEESKQIYERLYWQQLQLKETNPKMRQAFKVLLLAVIGDMNNQYSDFFDESRGNLIRLYGELYIVDLLEKLEGRIWLIQSNTDGVMFKIADGYTYDDVKPIIDEWGKRTFFKISEKHIDKIYQRDVNNYVCVIDDKVVAKGEAVKHFNGIYHPFDTDGYNSKEPIIIAQCVVSYLIYGYEPERVIEGFKKDLRWFQFICKCSSAFHHMEYEISNKENGRITSYPIQKTNRAFAFKNDKINGMIYRYKENGSRAKYPSLPSSVVLYDKEIKSEKAYESLKDMIDWTWYITRAYERIMEFINE